MIQQRNIEVRKTARYFLLGEPSQATDILFVCHGYGQLASVFLEQFQGISDRKFLIVAAEGLHRFYWEKFSGRVVASWMTKEDRDSDINDYVLFLDAVHDEVKPLCPPGVRVHALGFSQGAATVARWVARSEMKIESLIFWAGEFPKDINLEVIEERFNALRLIVVCGSADQFISNTKLYQDSFVNLGMKPENVVFEGKHMIEEETLRRLVDSL
jgi:predicted esterase